MLATGPIKEKILQWQVNKAHSNTVVENGEDGLWLFTQDDLEDLYRLDNITISDTHSIF